MGAPSVLIGRVSGTGHRGAPVLVLTVPEGGEWVVTEPPHALLKKALA